MPKERLSGQILDREVALHGWKRSGAPLNYKCITHARQVVVEIKDRLPLVYIALLQ